MALKDTFKHLRTLLHQVSSDLERAERGNKAASQRVRTGTIKLEKAAKMFRKESVKAERSGAFKKPKAAKKAPAKKSKPAKKASKSKASKKPAARKRATAKILKRR